MVETHRQAYDHLRIEILLRRVKLREIEGAGLPSPLELIIEIEAFVREAARLKQILGELDD